MTRPWNGDDDAGLSNEQTAAVDRLLARPPQEHLHRAAMIATTGANDAASRLLVIEHLLWALVKARDNGNANDGSLGGPLH